MWTFVIKFWILSENLPIYGGHLSIQSLPVTKQSTTVICPIYEGIYSSTNKYFGSIDESLGHMMTYDRTFFFFSSLIYSTGPHGFEFLVRTLKINVQQLSHKKNIKISDKKTSDNCFVQVVF